MDLVAMRRYREDDLRAMFEMDVLCFEEPFRFNRRSMKRFAEERNAIVLVAERTGGESPESGEAETKMAGFVIVHVERKADGLRGYVVTLDVAPGERRGGIAGQLMSEAERLSEAAGAQQMELHVFERNLGAIQFYERRGYERIGIARGFYGVEGGESLNAYVYRKEISDK